MSGMVEPGWMLSTLVAALAALVAALGLGGGSILLLILILFCGADQLWAQGLNLLLFVPTALIALGFHIKGGLVQPKTVLPALLPGMGAAALGFFLAAQLGSGLLSKLFAAMLLLLGLRELFAKPAPPSASPSGDPARKEDAGR